MDKKITWQYTHHLNSQYTTEIIKKGIYFANIRHKAGYRGEQMALVRFDGNKRKSRVPFSELKFVKN